MTTRPDPPGPAAAAAKTDVPLLQLSPEEVHARTRKAFRLGNRNRLSFARLLLALDESRGYLDLGFPTVVAYARRYYGLGRSTTLDTIRVARALPRLRRLAAACEGGQISWSMLSQLTRVATPETEVDWLRFAHGKDMPAIRDAVRRALRDGKASPPGDGWGLPNLDRKVTLRFPSADWEKVRRGLAAITRELAERLGRPVELEEVLLYLAERELARPAKEREPAGSPGAKYAVVYLECPTCGAAAMQTARGPLEVDREEVDRVRGDADVVRISGRKPASGSSDDRPTSASTIRRQVLLREGEFCANPHCHRRAVHWHHIRPRSEGGDDTLENGVALCEKCHALVHAGLLEVRRARDGRLFFRPRADRLPGNELDRLEKLGRREPVILDVVRKFGRAAGQPPRPPAPERRPEVRTSGRETGREGSRGELLVFHGSAPEDERLAEAVVRGLVRLGYSKEEARERVDWARKVLPPHEARDEKALLTAALRGKVPPPEDASR